jgi:uncharacterized protein (TIGR00251 family)
MTLPEALEYNIIYNSNCIRTTENYILIDLEISPGVVKPGIKGYNRWRDRILVHLRAPAKKGQANNELLKMLGIILNIDQNKIDILKGIKSEFKTIRVDGLSKKQVIERFIGASNEKL